MQHMCTFQAVQFTFNLARSPGLQLTGLNLMFESFLFQGCDILEVMRVALGGGGRRIMRLNTRYILSC
jgi:hypothetical protein